MKLDFGKDKTAIIKGVAIILMIVLHCSIPGYWDVPLDEFSNARLIRFLGAFKICVGIYTFMVGYGYAYSKSKDLKYSLTHIRKLLIPFWIILLMFTVPFCIKEIEIGNLILNMIGVNSSLNWFSWFVTFYIYAMVVMPFISRFIDKRPMQGALTCITLAFACEVVLHELYPAYIDNDWTQRLFDCLLQTPCMIIGYLFAIQRWFLKVKVPQTGVLSLPIAIACGGIILVIRSLYPHLLGFNMDFFYAPMLIFLILVVANQIHSKVVSKTLTTLGETSVYMWFFHALFFTETVRHVYQPFVAISDSLWIATLWTIVITFICSWCIRTLVLYFDKRFSINLLE